MAAGSEAFGCLLVRRVQRAITEGDADGDDADLGDGVSEMNSAERTVRPLASYAPPVGAALWMLEDTRARTLRAVDGLPAEIIDAIPIAGGNTIGALLYHIAAIEMDYLYADILSQRHPTWLTDLFPYDVRESNGSLSPLRGFSFDNHLQRLATTRKRLLKELQSLTAEDFVRPRPTTVGEATPEWIIHHLRQHEAEHRGQIQEIRSTVTTGGG